MRGAGVSALARIAACQCRATPRGSKPQVHRAHTFLPAPAPPILTIQQRAGTRDRGLAPGHRPHHTPTRIRGHTFAQLATMGKKSFKYVVLGGGNAAGYAAKRFVELGGAPGELAILPDERVRAGGVGAARWGGEGAGPRGGE